MKINELQELMEDLRGLEKLREQINKVLARKEVILEMHLFGGESRESIYSMSTHTNYNSLFGSLSIQSEPSQEQPTEMHKTTMGGNVMRELLVNILDDVQCMIISRKKVLDSILNKKKLNET